MKPKLVLLSVLGAASLLQGCIALPPLVQVERRDAPANSNGNSNAEVIKRLDAIDHRLDKLEQQQQPK